MINRRLKRGVVQVGRGRESASHGILVGGFEAEGLWILPAVWKTRPDLREDDSAAACVSHTARWTAHTTRRPQAPQAVIVCLHTHDNE